MACLAYPRDEAGEHLPEKWNDLKDNHQHFCVFLHMLGPAERAMVSYLQWYGCYNMASGKELDRNTLNSLFEQISHELALGYGQDWSEKWANIHAGITSQLTEDAFLAEMDYIRDEFNQNLIAWWANNASLVMALIWEMETSETAASHTHTGNDHDTSMQHDMRKYPKAPSSWESEWPELVPQVAVHPAQDTGPINYNKRQKDRQEMQRILQEEREKDRQEYKRHLQKMRDGMQRDMRHLSHEYDKTQEEMQELLRKELEQTRHYMQEMLRKDRHEQLRKEHGQTRHEMQELVLKEREQIKLACDKFIQEEREKDRRDYDEHLQETRYRMQHDIKKQLGSTHEKAQLEIRELLRKEFQQFKLGCDKSGREEREKDRQKNEKLLNQTREQCEQFKVICDTSMQEVREKERQENEKHLQEIRDRVQKDMEELWRKRMSKISRKGKNYSGKNWTNEAGW
ncbi:hypothetical protein DFS34DRAFT_695480 [Phlyctochytrium arcticum]|nr:hypothetical protein DFS34DRAFT_695480 [Phlyctochytrium arcticum]